MWRIGLLYVRASDKSLDVMSRLIEYHCILGEFTNLLAILVEYEWCGKEDDGLCS